jgi:Phage integrase family
MNTPIAVVDYLALTDSLAWSLGPVVAGDVVSGRAAGRGDPGAGLRYNAPPGAQLRDTAHDFRNMRGVVAEYQRKEEKEERVLLPLNVDMASPTPMRQPHAPDHPVATVPGVDVMAGATTLVHLLAIIESQSSTSNSVPMLRVAAKRIADFLGVPVEQVRTEALAKLGPEFKLDLQARGFKPATVRTYTHFASVLVAHANALGLLHPNTELEAAWAPVTAALGKQKGAATIIRYALSIGRMPQDFSIGDLRNWLQIAQRQGRTYAYLDNERSRFRRAMAQCGFQQELCDVIQWRGNYTVPMTEFPAGLAAEIQALAAWKQAKYSPGRKHGCRHRAVSAEKLTRFICQLYGFGHTVQHQVPIGTLAELITKQRVEAFVGWFINERERRAGPLRANLGLLAAAVKQYPALAGQEFSWLTELIKSIEEDDDEKRQKQDRKARHCLPYDVLAEVPEKIRVDREQGHHTPEQAALLVMYEFLLRFWLALPWRQRNIRECRLLGDHPNIFRGELPPSKPIAKPEWVEKALAENSKAQFCQLQFSASETKTGNELHAVLPLELVPALELYLAHRGALLAGPDPGTLFVHRGKAFTDKRLTMFLENLTFKYAGRPVNPHLLRDIFAYKWLEEHPEDYLTLSKILWHRDIKTTLRTYAENFNESNGVAGVDEWLQKRKQKK